jgi:hypothetical protein
MMVRTPGVPKRAPRVDVRKGAIVVNSDGDEIGVTLLDISGSGFRLQLSDKLHIGEFVQLRVDDDTVAAQIKWVLGDEAGGTFLAAAATKGL